MSRMVAGISTANAVRPMQEVMNHAQAVYGKRFKVIPLQRISSTVEMKFNDPSNWPTQKIARAVAQITCPVPCPGPASLPMALSGAYEVHPASGGPSPTKNAVIRTQKAVKVTQKDIMLKCGKGMSSAPVWIGRK